MSLPEKTLQTWRADLASGRTTSRELTERALAAISESSEGAATFIAVHGASARATADAIDSLHAAQLPLPPLAGIPISVKDLFDQAGQVTRAGSRVLEEAAPAAQDSAVVQRLRVAGAVLVGRTNMTEFAFGGLGLNPHYGTPRNPWDRATGRIPGGSSSGAAISVTDGMAAAAIGTDTGGSVRIPAALCGLTGFKPTARRVSTAGALPLSTTLDSIGPLAHSVACCALLDAVLSGEPLPASGPATLAGRSLAVPRTVVLDGLDETVARAFEAACRTLSAAGVRLVEMELPEFADLAHINRLGGFSAAEAWAWHAPLLQTGAARYDPRVVTRIRRGESMPASHYLQLLADRRRWIESVGRRLANANCEAMVMPTLPVVAPAIAPLVASDELYVTTNMLILRNPSIINFLDGCALTLPCHRSGEAPVGLTLAGLGGQDAQLLGLGSAVEAALAAGRT